MILLRYAEGPAPLKKCRALTKPIHCTSDYRWKVSYRMATILKRLSARTGKISWHARVRRKNQNLTKTFIRKADAQYWARYAEAAIDRGGLPESAQFRNRTVSDLLDLYEPHILQELKDATNRLYHLATVLFVIWSGSILLISLSIAC